MNMTRKTLRVRCPVCTAPMDLEYSLSYTGWERLTIFPEECPKGHALSGDLQIALAEMFDARAMEGVNDPDPRDICGYDTVDR